MGKSDITEILNEEIGYLVETMKDSMEYVGRKYDLSSSQISEMEKDFIACLAFAAIKCGEHKEEEEDCESRPAKDHCSFKESEKKPEKKIFPVVVWNCLRFVKDYCRDHDCDNCPVASASGIFCYLTDKPCDWEV